MTPRSNAPGWKSSVSTPPGREWVLPARSGKSSAIVPALCEERARISRASSRPFAGETHVLLALAGDVLEATTVDDAHVGKVIPSQGAAGDQWPWHGMVGDHCFSAGHLEHGLQGLDVAPEVIVQFLLRQVQEGLHAPSRVVVVDIDR